MHHDILGVDILGIDILGVDILGGHLSLAWRDEMSLLFSRLAR